jgi:dTDP-4-dehydrorhamnose 3,5-epimerase
MKAVETILEGVVVLEIEPIGDERGFFARTWDRAELASRGLTTAIEQVSIATNEVAGTLRGLHFQAAPNDEAKTVRCNIGRIFDVAVDLREGSSTYLKWFGVELSAGNRKSLFVPEGCAHGYITLERGTEVQYLISTPYNPATARGYRWDDPTLAIEWPIPIRRISARDAALPYVDGGRRPSPG